MVAVEVALAAAVAANDADENASMSASDDDDNALSASAASDVNTAEVDDAACTTDADNNEDNVAIGKRSSKSSFESCTLRSLKLLKEF